MDDEGESSKVGLLHPYLVGENNLIIVDLFLD